MIHKTRALVLHHIKYSDTSIIMHAYTEAYGRLSFMVQGVRKRNSRMKIGLFQPLSILDLEIQYKEKRQLQKIREARNAHPFQSIPHDYRKTSMALFMAELLYKTLREEQPDPDLFHFLMNHLRVFDLKKKGLANFHLFFMTQLTKYLGFFPHNNFDESNVYFDSNKGCFIPFKPHHNHYLEKPESEFFHALLRHSPDQHEERIIPKSSRLKLLHALVDFYYLHNPAMGHIHSFEILRETFR
ncbi:MAG: DNA repair protein RecO [Bacteroidales bacterium]|nr:DNA repair protein RecO [Bacteroidales bacterium]